MTEEIFCHSSSSNLTNFVALFKSVLFLNIVFSLLILAYCGLGSWELFANHLSGL